MDKESTYVVVRTLDETPVIYNFNQKNNTLYAFKMLPDFIDIKDFDSQIKINNTKFTTKTAQDMMDLLNHQNKWIEDSQAFIDMLMGELSKSAGFIKIGNEPKAIEKTSMPECDNYIYMVSPLKTVDKNKF